MFDKFKMFFQRLSPAQIIVGYYLLTVTVSTILLSLPFARHEGTPWSFIDGMFTAVSAVSVTGLSTINVAETFTTWGIVFLILILQVGGVGIMTLGTFFWTILRRKVGLRERRLIMTDQNQYNLAGLVHNLRQIIVIFLLIEAVGAAILGTYYLKFFPTWQEAYLNGLFASVSATTNAGFDITGQSLQPFAHDYFVQFIHMILIILGAIGFPVLIELKNYLMRKNLKERFNFTLNTKITTFTYFVILAVSVPLFFILEFRYFLQGKAWHESLFYSLFHSVSTRSAGLVTTDVSQLTESTQLVLSALMFIGASPSSVGGGIRTTTFALVVLFFYNYAKGKTSIKVFKREVHEEDYLKALVVTTLAVILCFISTLLLSITEDHSLVAILFEVCSAFGTSGMTMGITSELSTFGKIVIMLLMFIGRVGILSFLFMIGGKEQKENYRFPKERVIIG